MLPNLGDPNNNQNDWRKKPISEVFGDWGRTLGFNPGTNYQQYQQWLHQQGQTIPTIPQGFGTIPNVFQPSPFPPNPYGGMGWSSQFAPQNQTIPSAFPIPYNPLANVQPQPPQAPYNPLSSAQAPQSAQNVSYNPLSSANAGKTNNGKVGVSGGIGTTNVQGNAGNGVTQTKPQTNSDGSYFDSNGNKRSTHDLIDYAYRFLDGNKDVGIGFTDSFIQRHGVDPISFYMRAFTNDPRAKGYDLPGSMGAEGKQWLISRAAQAAESDARFLPGAVAEWQKVHGNAEIPPEQWDRWWSISQSTGGYPMNVGEGQNAYGVY